MSASRRGATDGGMGRREALRLLGFAGGAALLGGCTPMRVFMGWYPSDFRDDELVRRTLAAFADTLVPGVESDGEHLARPLYDERFPLHRYLGYLAADLSRRARDECGDDRFHLLSRADRTRAIDAGLRAGGTTEKLYTGAIFLVQLGFYGGIYDDDAGCPEIDFDGRYRPCPAAERTYAHAGEFLAEELGHGGNHA